MQIVVEEENILGIDVIIKQSKEFGRVLGNDIIQ